MCDLVLGRKKNTRYHYRSFPLPGRIKLQQNSRKLYENAGDLSYTRLVGPCVSVFVASELTFQSSDTLAEIKDSMQTDERLWANLSSHTSILFITQHSLRKPLELKLSDAFPFPLFQFDFNLVFTHMISHPSLMNKPENRPPQV